MPQAAPGQPHRVLAGFATVEAAPGASVQARIELSPRATQTWSNGTWLTAPGKHHFEIGRSISDIRLTLVRR